MRRKTWRTSIFIVSGDKTKRDKKFLFMRIADQVAQL